MKLKQTVIAVLAVAFVLGNITGFRASAYAVRPRPAQTTDTLLRMLPSFGGVVTIDVTQLNQEIEQQVAGNVDLASKIHTKLAQMAAKTGVDAQTIDQIAISFSLPGGAGQPHSVVVASGVFNQDQILARLRESSGKKWKKKNYSGENIYIAPARKGKNKKSETRAAISFFDNQSIVAFGPFEDVKKAVDARSGAAPSAVQDATLIAALNQTSVNASVRFAFAIPEEIRQLLANASGPGAFLRPLSKVTEVTGSVDLNDAGLLASVSLLTASSGESASVVALVNQGLALARLALSGHDDLLEILDGVSAAAVGNTAQITVSLSADLINRLIEEYGARGFHLGRKKAAAAQ